MRAMRKTYSSRMPSVKEKLVSQEFNTVNLALHNVLQPEMILIPSW